MMDFEAVLNKALAQVSGAVADGVKEACDDLLSDSQDLVPYQEGDLSRSGKVTVEADRDGAQGVVSFDTPYAVVQHEDTSMQHQDGRRPHYLGDPLRQNARKYMEHIADKARDAFE